MTESEIIMFVVGIAAGGVGGFVLGAIVTEWHQARQNYNRLRKRHDRMMKRVEEKLGCDDAQSADLSD